MRGFNQRWTIRPIRYGFGAAVVLCAMAGGPLFAGEAVEEPKFDDAALEFFEKEVRPILTARCLECHGAGKGDPKGGLDLTNRLSAIKGGDTGAAVIPGNIKESLLVSAIEYGDLYQMPPKSKLPPQEIATLTKWVERGAPWPKETVSAAGTVKPFDLAARKAEHWCWQPVKDPAIPPVKDESWPLSTYDRFILAKLESQGLAPASAAEKHTLLRRVYFDLIGLPPTPDELAAFEKDSSPQAFERVVDRLLESAHFGERWGRHWLDLVRYAETRGHEFEPSIPNAWQYRDYVIRAINADVPYDRFLQEHIAGDLIGPRWRNPTGGTSPINEAPLGTGFWFLGEEVHSPVDIRKDETDRMDNRLDVMSKTFLGLTVSCARCHDHKFDAISQRDYYALTGYLLSGSYRQVRVQTQEHDRQIASRLETLRAAARRDVSTQLATSAKPALDRLAKYLQIARQAVIDRVLTDTALAAVQPREVVFADFEGESYKDWKVEGTAFADRPPRKDDNIYKAPLTGFQGDRLVNSHRNAAAGADDAAMRDAHVGRLISPWFTIDRNAIQFQIGGGSHPGKTCINLEVDGKIVRTSTGHNSGSLRTELWDVAEWLGKRARIEVVDDERGGWGHILLDHIVFTDKVAPDDVSRRQIAVAREKVEPIARAHQLNPEILWKWCLEMALAKSESGHWLHPFVSQRPAPVQPDQQAIDPSQVVVDFRESKPGTLIQDGVSFGLVPVSAGQLQFRLSAAKTELGVHTSGGWARDLFWKNQALAAGTEDDHGTMGSWHRHGRMVRTPEFTLTAGRLWYLVRGSVRAYVSVNSHLVVAGPLHGSVLREFKQSDDQWHWVSHELELYRGHRMHIEFFPADDADCSVAEVVQSHDQPPLLRVSPQMINGPAGQDLASEAAATQLQAQFSAAINGLSQRQEPAGLALASSANQVSVADWFVRHLELFLDSDGRKLLEDRLAQLRRQEANLAREVQWESQLAPAMLDGNGVDEWLLIRGNSSTPRDPVPRRFLEALNGQAATEAAPGSGRVELAEEMLRSPLATRVAVNRIWYHLFGRGIVPSVDNMGVLGQSPTHPELLDHLATEFVKQGWSTKRLIKVLLLTRTYQMSSKPLEPAETRDPDNLLWHRMPIKRLEGEIIRDSLLAVSGRLDRTPLGPSVPIHLTPFMEGRGRPSSGPLDGNGRRSIYISVRRNFLSPMMLAFDTPAPFSTVGRRTISNVPAQALILMNDPLVLEMSRRWAENLLSENSTTAEQRIDKMYRAAFARLPTPAEKTEALQFLDAQGQLLGTPARERRNAPQAWSDLCHVMFNLKEFIFIE